MALLLFLIVVGFGVLAVFRLLTPEMYVRLNHRPRFHFPWGRAHLIPDVPAEAVAMEELPMAIDTPMQPEEMPIIVNDKLIKLETLLLEKNKLIERLQRELEAERSTRKTFENVKAIMDAELNRLKSDIKSLKQERSNV